MDEKAFARIRDWVEPAHPAIVRLLEDLVSIYRLIREQVQEQLDREFDGIARRIGFVVTTSVPFVFRVAEKGKIQGIDIDAPHLKGTIFEERLEAALRPLADATIDRLSPGNHKVLVIWSDALKLKLRRDWIEPAHVVRGAFARVDLQRLVRVRPEVMEPAHWFDPGLALAVEEAVLISAIDEVYPELRLAERIAAERVPAHSHVIPDSIEPAHFRPERLFSDREFMAALVELVRRFAK